MDGSGFGSEPAITPAISTSTATSGGEWPSGGGDVEHPVEDLRVPGVAADASALLPWVDADDHAPATVKKTRPRPRKAKRANKPKPAVAAPTAPTSATPAATTPGPTATSLPPDFAEKLAAMKASAFTAALMVHGKKGDRNSQYEMMHVLESADDALTRKKMKEQFAAQSNGSLTDYLGKQTWDSAYGKEQALDLVSDKRDATTDKLAAMSPDARADLEDKAAGWADKILDVTRGTDRDDSENADKIAAILGPRSPEEIEVIRKRVRLQTSGTKSTTVFEELDRTFTERDESIAMAGLASDPVKVAQTQLVDAAAEGDPERIHAIAKQLGPESMWKLHASDPMLAGRVIASMPADRRGELSALMNGKADVAEGARIASMLQPVDLSGLSAADAMNGTAAKKMKQKEAQDPERLIAELSRSSPEALNAARKAWDEGGHGKSWDELIATTFEDADPTVRMRVEAAASGDVVGEKALRLRQGMKTFDQKLIDGALANPDLQSSDAKKRAAAQAERRALEQRLQEYDANEQRTTALLAGAPTENVQGRSVDEQLSAYFERRREHDSGSGSDSPFGAVRNIAEKDERMAKIREKAAVDRYAAKEMWHEGDAQLSTKVRRAELAGDTTKKAEILENAKKGSIDTHDADYQRKFGGERSMLAAPDLSGAENAAKIVARITGDDRPTDEIAAELARNDMNVGELRMQHVRETGALADRTREQRITQQKEIRVLSESGFLTGEEQMRFALGGSRGSEDLHASAIAILEQSGGSDVDDREFQRRDTSTTKALELQREEKQKSAASVAQALSIAGKIAALLTANPALFVAVDAGFSAARIAAQELIANEAYDATADIKHMAVDMAVNLATARLASLGKGVEAGSQAAKGVQTMQRLGNAGAAMGGAAAHSMIDGGDAGGAVLHAGIGAILPGYLRGKAENAIKGTSRGANIAREGFGAVVDTATNVVVGGGHVDAGTAIDLVGGGVQGRIHGGHARKATAHEHAAMAKHRPDDVDLPSRSTSHEGIRRTGHEVDPRHAQYARIEEHARDLESRRQAESAYHAHSHLVDDGGAQYQAQAVHVPSIARPSAAESTRTAVSAAADTSRSDTPTASQPARIPTQGDHDALVDLAVNESKTPEHKEQIVRWGEELDHTEDFGPHREVLREMNLDARKESPYPSKEHGAALREWAHEGQLDRLPMVEALRHEGVDPDAVQHVFDKAVKNDASASENVDALAIHTAADGTPLARPLSDHPDSLTRDEITLLADLHGRRSDHAHGPYTTSGGRELPGSPMRKVVPGPAAHDYQTGVRLDNTGQPVPNDKIGGYVGLRATTEGAAANETAGRLGLDYDNAPYVDSSGTRVSPTVAQYGLKAAEWHMTPEQDAIRKVPFGVDAQQHIRDHRRHLEEVGAHIPTLYEGDHRLDTSRRTSQQDPGTGWGFSASERLLDSEGRPHRPVPNQELTLKYTKLPSFDVAHIPSEAQVARNKAARDLFARADAAKKSRAVDPSLSTSIPEVLDTVRHARTSDVDPARQAKREEFEGTLANHPKVQELVTPTLDMMSNKLLDYITVMYPDAIDEKLSSLGVAPSKRGYAGAIGTDPDVIREALQSGNIRERMVLLSEFQENVLGKDALQEGGLARMRERFGGEHAGAFTIEDVNRLAALQAQLASSLPGDAKGTTSKALFDVHPNDPQHAEYRQAKNEGGDTKLPQFTAEAASAQLGRPLSSPTPAGEGSPFARTKLTIAEANARGMALSQREMAFAESQGGPHLPWVVGSQANMVNPDAPFIRGARDSALPLKAGISGTTFRGMRLAEVMGANADMARLALFSQLNGIEAHSFHEIASAANGYFGENSSSRYNVHAPYTEGSTGIDAETLRSVAESVGMSIEELNLFVGNDRNAK